MWWSVACTTPVEIVAEPLGYNWWLGDALGTRHGDAARERGFDFCLLDGAHEWNQDALAFLLVARLLRPGGWLFYLCVAAALSFSAFFELLEWWAALIWGGDADAFLATQGDVWDTQWDMFLALCGSIVSQLLWSRLHNRQLQIS